MTRGPVPKRQAERRRRNKDAVVDTVVMEGAVKPATLPHSVLHRVAREWYRSLKRSGQAQFFEPSDWAAAVLVAEAMSKVLMAEKFQAAAFKAVFDAADTLLTTEQARRRARLEVKRLLNDEEEPEGVTAIEGYRTQLEA